MMCIVTSAEDSSEPVVKEQCCRQQNMNYVALTAHYNIVPTVVSFFKSSFLLCIAYMILNCETFSTVTYAEQLL